MDFATRPRPRPKRDARRKAADSGEAVEFGSNGQAQDQVAAKTDKTETARSTGKKDELGQATDKRNEIAIYRTLKVGRDGDDVKVLQRLLGLTGDDVDGDFGGGTKKLVMAWQQEKGLKPDGVVGKDTVRQMRGDPEMYGYSWHHDPDKFVPTYAMTAYHESGIYRTDEDPYAVGAVTKPRKDQDLGGKTYGTYQFESYVYKDGTKGKKELVDNSTVMRFINSSKNPYGKQLKEVVKKHGIASAEFDTLWKKLASEKNEAFGDAQEAFLEEDKEKTVKAFLDRAGASDEVKADADIKDLVMGTTNHVGTLANGAADHLAATQKKNKKKLTVNEFGRALTTYKGTKIPGWFKKSPGAHAGIEARFKQEATVFE